MQHLSPGMEDCHGADSRTPSPADQRVAEEQSFVQKLDSSVVAGSSFCTKEVRGSEWQNVELDNFLCKTSQYFVKFRLSPDAASSLRSKGNLKVCLDVEGNVPGEKVSEQWQPVEDPFIPLGDAPPGELIPMKVEPSGELKATFRIKFKNTRPVGFLPKKRTAHLRFLASVYSDSSRCELARYKSRVFRCYARKPDMVPSPIASTAGRSRHIRRASGSSGGGMSTLDVSYSGSPNLSLSPSSRKRRESEFSFDAVSSSPHKRHEVSPDF